MIVIENDFISPYDVDDTLVMWNFSEHDLPSTIEIGCGDFTQRVLPHLGHIQAIKNAKARGHYVVVWSAGGYDWAKSVVEQLNLTPYVDLIMSKPRWYCDDVEVKDWLTTRFYIPLVKK